LVQIKDFDLEIKGNRFTELLEILAYIITLNYTFENLFFMEQFRKLLQMKIFQARLQKMYYNTNTFQNFHFVNSIFLL